MPEIKISFLSTGSGTSTTDAHTALVYDCDDGTRLLIDTSSGNSVAGAVPPWGSPLIASTSSCCPITTATTCPA